MTTRPVRLQPGEALVRCSCGELYRLPNTRERYLCFECGKRLPTESAVLLIDLAAGAQLVQAVPEEPAQEPASDVTVRVCDGFVVPGNARAAADGLCDRCGKPESEHSSPDASDTLDLLERTAPEPGSDQTSSEPEPEPQPEPEPERTVLRGVNRRRRG